jgi:hypothetical protein
MVDNVFEGVYYQGVENIKTVKTDEQIHTKNLARYR